MNRLTFWFRNAALACAFATVSGFAQTAITWSSTSGTSFASGSNWTGGIAPADSLATHIATFAALSGAANPILSTSQSVAGLNFSGGTYTLTNSGGAALTLGSGVSNIAISADVVTNAQTVNLPLVLGAAQTWRSNASNSQLNISGTVNTNGFALTLQSGNTGTTSNINLSGPVSGTGSLTKTGNSTLTLSAANSYSGGTTIGGSNTGTLNINQSGSGGTSSAIGTGTLTISGTTTINNTSGSSVTLSTNNAQSWGGNLTFVGTNSLNLGTGAVTLTGNRTITTSANTLTVGGNIGGSFGLTKTGNGTLTLSATSSAYTGSTTINAGILSVSTLANGGVASGIGQSTNAAGNLVIDGGTLQYTGAAVSTDRKFKIGDATVGGTATLEASGTGALAFTATGVSAFTYGTANQTRSLVLTGSNTDNNSIAGILADNGTGLTSVAKTGAGKWLLTAANTYTGGTTINAGTLSFANGSLGTTGAITMNGGTLQWNGSNAQDISSRFTMVAATAATVDTNGNNVTFANAFGGSTSGSLVKSGTGTLTLSGNNTFSGGATVSAGTISAGHANALGSGSVSIGGSGTLAVGSSITIPNNIAVTGTLNGAAASSQFSGTISGNGTLAGTLTIASGGSIAPGNSPGILNVSGAVTYASGSHYNWELAAFSTSTPGTNFDQILIGTAGSLTINSGATLVPSFSGTATSPASGNVFWNASQSWTVVDKTGGGTVTGTAFSVDNSAWSSAGSFATAISSNSVLLTWTPSAIPEPSTYAAIFGALALTGTVWHRRRQRKAV